MRILCIAEKPSIARAITEILGGGGAPQRLNQFSYKTTYNFPEWGGDCDVVISAVRGHLTSTDYTDQGSWGTTPIIDLFTKSISTTIPKDMKKVESNIKTIARGMELLLIFTDCDREGEYIGQEIVNVVKSVNKRIMVKRVWFNNIEKVHILEALKNPRNVDMNIVNAVEARIELDLRIGCAFTRFITMTLQAPCREKLDKKVLSFGSCQFPTLGFVVDRYRKSRGFVPESFWYIKMSISKDDQVIPFRWIRNHLFDYTMVIIMLESCLQEPKAIVERVVKKQTKKWRPLPLTTVELQKQASKMLGLSSKRVLDLAEKLYQQGYISYPRTETDQFDKAIDLKKLIDKQRHDGEWGEYAASLLDDGKYRVPRNGKRNDGAHPPIHPIIPAGPEIRGNQELIKVYKFIARRFLACCSEDAKGESTRVIIKWGQQQEEFIADGLVVLEENYLKVYPYDKWQSSQLMAKFTVGEMVNVCEGNIVKGETSGPALLTEADLITLMDANGIGTDATMCDHIEKIIEREYIIKNNSSKELIPTTLGMGLIESFENIGQSNLCKPILRKNIEFQLIEISNGIKSKNVVIQNGIDMFKNIYISANENKLKIIQTVKQRLEIN